MIKVSLAYYKSMIKDFDYITETFDYIIRTLGFIIKSFGYRLCLKQRTFPLSSGELLYQWKATFL